MGTYVEQIRWWKIKSLKIPPKHLDVIFSQQTFYAGLFVDDMGHLVCSNGDELFAFLPQSFRVLFPSNLSQVLLHIEWNFR